jgi:hypothetical protein
MVSSHRLASVLDTIPKYGHDIIFDIGEYAVSSNSKSELGMRKLAESLTAASTQTGRLMPQELLDCAADKSRLACGQKCSISSGFVNKPDSEPHLA